MEMHPKIMRFLFHTYLSFIDEDMRDNTRKGVRIDRYQFSFIEFIGLQTVKLNFHDTP